MPKGDVIVTNGLDIFLLYVRLNVHTTKWFSHFSKGSFQRTKSVFKEKSLAPL